MAGLLDYGADPLGQGLLQMGATLMQPRALGGGVANGLLAFNAGAMQAQQYRRALEQDARRNKLIDAQIAENLAQADDRKRKRQLEDQLQAAAKGAYTPAVPDTWEGPGTPERFDMSKFFTGVAQVAPLEAMRMRKEMMGDNKPVVVGDNLVDPVTGRPIFSANKPQVVSPGASLVQDGKAIYTAPDKPDLTEIEKLVQARDALPMGHPNRAVLDQAIRKATTHAPAANQTVYTGTMVPVEGPDGKPRFVMPGKDGTAVEIPGLRPPGSAKEERADANRKQSTLDMANRMVADVDSALAKVSRFSTGTTGRLLSSIPATDAADLRATVTTLKANLGFNELQAIRAASPTGGALGATSENELMALQSTIANLDPNQSPAQLTTNLNKVKRHMQNLQRLINQQSAAGVQTPGASGGWSIQKVD